MPSRGARKPGQGRVSGEYSERNLDPVEHARTLSERSEPFLVSTCRPWLVAAARSRLCPLTRADSKMGRLLAEGVAWLIGHTPPNRSDAGRCGHCRWLVVVSPVSEG